ncbi:phage tail sheath family protein [Angelakisella massiliensis]|uniref:phage tail sheath family protein n=1 Tax=Angelakisella massiliensis TaxID=1871018 RepID=UPI0023A7B84E|nr:phage tail sheath family protein [Angelakisella massiliensis]
MAEYLSPGVYVEEFESGGKPMEGVGTSTAGFVGLAERGPVGGVPVLVTNFADYKRKFGGYLSASEFGDYRFLAYCVEHFFLNGGSRAFISRCVPADAKVAEGSIPEENPMIRFFAANPGQWGDDINVILTPASKAKTQILEKIDGAKYRVKKSVGFENGDVVVLEGPSVKKYNVVVKSLDNIIEFAEEFEEECVDTGLVPQTTISTCEFNLEVKYDDVDEFYGDVSFNINSANYLLNKVAKSSLVRCEVVSVPEGDPFQALSKDGSVASVALKGGSNGSKAAVTPDVFMGTDNGPGKRTGIQAFLDNDTASIMAVPGITDPSVQLTLVAHCENLASRFAVLDMPEDLSKTDEILTHRSMVDSTYAAMYHPWLTVFDPMDKRNINIPPSGSVVGIYARSDNSRGVHKAPANEVVRGCVGLSVPFNKGEQDILNPKGVNLIRSFPGQGIRVWGARTTSSDPSWKYVNVRRLFIYLEESIKANTNWVVFEPNDERLWARVKRTIDGFLKTMWRSGALAGSTEAEAFFCNIDHSTMTQDDIDNGRLICVIGVAPVKPAEFVIFRITQKTGEAG